MLRPRLDEHDVNHVIKLILHFPVRRETALLRRSVQSQDESGLPTQLMPISFRCLKHTFLYLYPRDT